VPQLPHGISAVADQLVEHAEPERVATLVLPRLDAAKLSACTPARLLWCDTRTLEVGCVALDVEAQLVVHLLLDGRASEDGAHQGLQPWPRVHACLRTQMSSVGVRARLSYAV
jgi:hypothetical protein